MDKYFSYFPELFSARMIVVLEKMINNNKLYSFKYLFLIIFDFTLIITSKFASIFILEEKFYIKNGFFIELLISLTIYLILL